MKIYTVLAFLLLFVAGVATAQTKDVSGTIKDEEGQPVHFAFLKDIESKSSVYTDSLGNFTISINPNSSLYINCFGFRDTLIKVDNRTNIAITLKNAVNITAAANDANNPNAKGISHDAATNSINGILSQDHTVSPGQTIKSNTVIVGIYNGIVQSYSERSAIVDAAQGAIYPQFNPKEETQGSRYLLKGWIHGYVINSKDEVIQDPGYLFEYDKIGGGLLLTKDSRSAIEVDRDVVKGFTLYDNSNVPYVFENIPQIDPSHYVQVISSCDRYKIYKDIKTTFAKANYATDGVMSTGHNYDEYTDEYTYYVYDVKTNAFQKMSLKKKAIKEAFAANADKLNKFMSDHSSDSIDDMYLAELCSSLND